MLLERGWKDTTPGTRDHPNRVAAREALARRLITRPELYDLLVSLGGRWKALANEYVTEGAALLEPADAPRIVFVCAGNINRSPAAELLLRRLLPDTEIRSAGTSGQSVGKHMARPMRAALEAMGIKPEETFGHRAVQLSRDLVEWATHIYVMDGATRKKVLQYHACSHKKVQMMSPYGDVDDPAFRKNGATADSIAREIDFHCARIAKEIVQCAA